MEMVRISIELNSAESLNGLTSVFSNAEHPCSDIYSEQLLGEGPFRDSIEGLFAIGF